MEFDSEWGLTQHYIQSPDHHYCRFCYEHFDDEDDLEEHNDDEHGYCSLCDKVCPVISCLYITMLNSLIISQLFKTEEGLHQHSRQVHRYYCEDCEEVYGSEWALTQHYIQSSDHHYCRFCDENFDDEDDLDEHNNDEHGYCSSCDKVRWKIFSLYASTLNALACCPAIQD